MPSSKVSALTKNDITATARSFRWNRQLPKWSVIVEGRELPARPLILEAAGVPPNDPTNSHQAVAILKQQGFEIRYQGRSMQETGGEETGDEKFEHALQRLRGSFAGSSLLEDREREHKIEKTGSNR
jgi:hypothetical protein